MSDQNESNQEYNSMAPKIGKDDKTTNSSSSSATADVVEEDLNGNIFSLRNFQCSIQ